MSFHYNIVNTILSLFDAFFPARALLGTWFLLEECGTWAFSPMITDTRFCCLCGNEEVCSNQALTKMQIKKLTVSMSLAYSKGESFFENFLEEDAYILKMHGVLTLNRQHTGLLNSWLLNSVHTVTSLQCINHILYSGSRPIQYCPVGEICAQLFLFWHIQS